MKSNHCCYLGRRIGRAPPPQKGRGEKAVPFTKLRYRGGLKRREGKSSTSPNQVGEKAVPFTRWKDRESTTNQREEDTSPNSPKVGDGATINRGNIGRGEKGEKKRKLKESTKNFQKKKNTGCPASSDPLGPILNSEWVSFVPLFGLECVFCQIVEAHFEKMTTQFFSMVWQPFLESKNMKV